MSQTFPNTDYLLVPMNVQAAIVNDAAANNIWSRGKMNYTELSKFNSASPGPFSGSDENIDHGVHLLWELPGAFRHGMHNPNSDAPPSYPLAPNRWLVARFWPGGTSAPRQCKAWIISSDDTSSGKSPFVNPAAQGGDSWDTKFGSAATGSNQIGSATLLNDWTEVSDPNAKLFLQALGPGSVTFSSFSPNVENVFSFVDDATDNQETPAPVITKKNYAINSASGTTIIIDTDTPSDLSSIFTTNGSVVLYSNNGWSGAYTIESTAVGTSTFTITTSSSIDPSAEGTSGIVIPVQDSYQITATNANTFTISSSSDLSSSFPDDSFFYLTGSTTNNNSYQIVNTSFNSSAQTFTITVGGSGGTISDSTAIDGAIWLGDSNQFANFDYLVAGWYSSPDADPLSQATNVSEWASVLSGLNWVTNPGPYPVSSIGMNEHTGNSDISIRGLGDLTSQFTAGSTISVVGNTATTSYTLVSGSTAAIYNQTTDTNVLTITTIASGPDPSEQFFVLPSSLSGQSFPSNSLIHGQINSVTWQTSTQPKRPNLTELEVNHNVKVAVGNSSIDALSAAFVQQQQNDLGIDSITGAQSYSGDIAEANAPITLSSIDSDLTDEWFPANSSIVLSETDGTPLGTYRVASTLYDETTKNFYIYLAQPFTIQNQTISYPYSLQVTPTYVDAELMDAFQTNQLSLLDQPGGRSKLNISLEKEAFRPESGGTLWKLQAISGKPIFQFAIASVSTVASPGFTIDTSNYSSNTTSQLSSLFAAGQSFSVSGTPGSSPAGQYLVQSTSSATGTFTIVTTTTPATTTVGATNSISIAGSDSVLPISFNIFKLLSSPSNGFTVQSDVDLSARFAVGSSFTVTGPTTSVAGTYTVASVDYSNAPSFEIHTTAAPANTTFTSNNRIEIDNSTLADERAQWLANVNILQDNLDRETRILHALQSECYARWWQTNYISLGASVQNISTSQSTTMQDSLGAVEAGVINQMMVVNSWTAKLQTCILGLNVDTALITSEELPELNAYWELKPTERSRFYQPKDPVLLISGLDSSFEVANGAVPNAPLPCRYSSQVATSLEVNSTPITTALIQTADDLDLSSFSKLPIAISPIATALSYESLFLNLGAAPLLTTVVTGITANEVATAIEAQTGYTNAAGNAAVLPSPLAVQQWQQAWMPMYMDWDVNWLATQAATASSEELGWGDWFFDQKAWEFNGLDYDFTDALPFTLFGFTYDSGSESFTLDTSNNNLYLSSLIENNSLLESNSTPHAINSSSYASGVLTIKLQNNPITADTQLRFQFTVGRQGFALTAANTSTSFAVKASYDEYIRFQESTLSVFVFHNDTTYGTYTIGSISYDIATEILTLATSAPSSGTYIVGDNLYLITTYTTPASIQGRTFVTPEATFNFRSRLQQYINTHTGTLTTEHLQEVEHILDIIGGQDFPIAEAGNGGNQFVIASEIELGHLFPIGSTCYVSQSSGQNNGAYTVSAAPTLSAGYVTIPVHETVKDSPLGILTPAPHQWDLMSQTLSGFTDQLIMRSQESNVSPGSAPAIHVPTNGGGGGPTSYVVSAFDNQPNQFSPAKFEVDVPTDISANYKSGGTFIITESGSGNLGGTYTLSADSTYSGTTLTLSFMPGGIVTIPQFPVFQGCNLQTGKAVPNTPVLTATDFSNAPWYALNSSSVAPNTISFDSSSDLSQLFPVGQPCYFADANSTPAAYTVTPYDVVSVSHDSSSMTITISGTLTGTPTGFIGPDMSSIIGGHHLGFPILGAADNASQTSGASYFPIRGGFFEFKQLQIVDRFGQVVDLLFANNNAVSMATEQDIENAWETFAPIKSRMLTPEPNTNLPNTNNRLSKLEPRIVTPARLDFSFVDGSGGANDKIDIDLLAEPEPVCGWLLPNHVDGGVSVYDAGGGILGELVLSTIPDEPIEVIWYTAGAISSMTLAALSSTEISNPYLLGILKGLGERLGDSVGEAFQNLLQAIDETLWTIDDSSSQSDQHMALLLGRPLAVVRSRLKFTLNAHPDFDQTSTYYTDTDTFDNWTPTPAATGTSAYFTITNTTATESTDLSDLAEKFVPKRTISVDGDTENSGSYHIIDTVQTFNNPGYTLQINVIEDIPTDNPGGTLQLNPPDGGTTELNWPVRLGRSDLYDDGLIGYFIDGDDYKQFNSVHTPLDRNDVGYLNPIGSADGNYLSLPFHAEASRGAAGASIPTPTPESASVFVTMLVDPRAAVNATTSLLPTKSVELPNKFIKKALENMAVTFRVGPLLTDSSNVQMPLPNESKGQWAWQEVKIGTETIVTKSVTQSGKTVQLPKTPLILQDGWLSLQQFDTDGGNGTQ